MEDTRKQVIELVLNGFFYFFGFKENPARKFIHEISHTSSSEKIRNDLRRVNKNYRKQYELMREKILCD
jgi:hypothetical protein